MMTYNEAPGPTMDATEFWKLFGDYEREDTDCQFSDLSGQTIVNIQGDKGDEFAVLTLADGRQMGMAHIQDCCESVTLESIRGDIEMVVGHEIEYAAETSGSAEPALSFLDDSHTWTYYYIRTEGGSIVIRWYGTSNRYYSENVYCRWLTTNAQKGE